MFGKSGCEVRNGEGELFVTGTLVGELFKLDEKPAGKVFACGQVVSISL